MTLREMRDDHAVVWQIWDVRPSGLSAAKTLGGPSHVPRPVLQPALADGWLTFESAAGERRRMVPIPPGWDAFDDTALGALLTRATPIPPRPRRFIE